jgi:S-methylmethionine-dependent homocysteine/selenocysteine methylase
MIILDAPIGTRLIRRGIEAARVVHAVLDAPSSVTALHEEDVAAGADVILSSTFALPFMAANDAAFDPTAHLRAALACAMSASKNVWVSFGPPVCDDPFLAQRAMDRVLTSLRLALRTTPIMAVCFETLSTRDAAWLPAALASLRAEDVGCAVSFLSGQDFRLDEPVYAIGTNCSAFAPKNRAEHEASFQRVLTLGVALKARTFIKPAMSDTTPSEWLVAQSRSFDMAGVCCGGTSEHLRALREAYPRGTDA